MKFALNTLKIRIDVLLMNIFIRKITEHKKTSNLIKFCEECLQNIIIKKMFFMFLLFCSPIARTERQFNFCSSLFIQIFIRFRCWRLFLHQLISSRRSSTAAARQRLSWVQKCQNIQMRVVREWLRKEIAHKSLGSACHKIFATFFWRAFIHFLMSKVYERNFKTEILTFVQKLFWSSFPWNFKYQKISSDLKLKKLRIKCFQLINLELI